METHHLALSVRGYIAGPDKDLKGLFLNHKTGLPLTPREAREFLMNELVKGHEVLPIGKPCEGFDFKKNGCPGHEQSEEVTG